MRCFQSVMRGYDVDVGTAGRDRSEFRITDRAYIAWTTVAVAYAIAFLQRVSPQSVSLGFMHDFGTDAAGVAMLASSYFWGYTLMQIPAGLLVDRYGVRRVVLCSMAASSLGSAAFALAPNLLDVFAARLIVACGDALVFTALLKLVAQSFSDERFGFMSGISQVSGYVGGVMATTPLAAAVSGFGWRACFIFIACVGAANLALASVALKPAPATASEKTLAGVLSAAWRSLSRAANWGCAMTFASHFAVVTTLSGVWGIPMVAHLFNISPSAAGAPLLVFMIGNAVGSIFLGHLADRAAAALDTALIRICLLRMGLDRNAAAVVRARLRPRLCRRRLCRAGTGRGRHRPAGVEMHQAALHRGPDRGRRVGQHHDRRNLRGRHTVIHRLCDGHRQPIGRCRHRTRSGRRQRCRLRHADRTTAFDVAARHRRAAADEEQVDRRPISMEIRGDRMSRLFLRRSEVGSNFAVSSWQSVMFSEFEAQMSSEARPFPCVFGVAGYRQDQLRYLFLDPFDVGTLGDQLARFVAECRGYGPNTSLIVFTRPRPVQTLEAYYRKFWLTARPARAPRQDALAGRDPGADRSSDVGVLVRR